MQHTLKESSVCFWPSKVGNTENFVGYKVTWKSEDVSPSFTTHRLVVQPDAEVCAHVIGGEGRGRGSKE